MKEKGPMTEETEQGAMTEKQTQNTHTHTRALILQIPEIDAVNRIVRMCRPIFLKSLLSVTANHEQNMPPSPPHTHLPEFPSPCREGSESLHNYPACKFTSYHAHAEKQGASDWVLKKQKQPKTSAMHSFEV